MKLTKRDLMIVCGALVLVMAALCTWLYLWAVSNQKQKWGSIVCRVNVKLLSLACAEYDKEHGDTLPVSLDELRPYLSTALQRLKARPSEDPYLKVWEDYGGRSDPFVCPL